MGDRPTKLDQKKSNRELAQEIKNKGEIFWWKNNMKFCSSGEKMRNASGHQGENEQQWKKENKNMYDISSIKRVTRKFHVVVLQNNGTN